jgi:hypothetical protein
MSYGLVCVCKDNLVINTSTVTGVLRDFFVLSSEVSGSIPYPDLAGRTVYAATARGLSGSGSAFRTRTLSVTVSYGLGYPVVAYSPTGSGPGTLVNLYVIVE